MGVFCQKSGKWQVFFCIKVDVSSTQGALCTVSVFFILHFAYRVVRTHPMHPLPTGLQSMRSRVYETVECPSVRPSVCLSHRSTAAACGGFAAERPAAGRRYRSIAVAGAQQQRRRAAASAGSAVATAERRG